MRLVLCPAILLTVIHTLSFAGGKCITEPTSISVPNTLYGLQDTLLYEDFEGAFPPAGWDTVEISGTVGGVTPIPWHHSIYPDEPYQHTDSGGASYGWGYNLNGWMRITGVNLWPDSTIALSFWWISSYAWHVFPHDNGDLFVKVSTDAGISWNTLWTFGDSAKVDSSGVMWPWQDWVWYESTISLKPYAGMDSIMIGFHVIADDNADIGLDDVVIGTSDASIVSEVPYLRPIKPPALIIQPNPVRDQVLIKFTLCQPTQVKINIQNVVGACVREYQYTDPVAGHHTLQWDGNDNFGKPVPAGVYLITLNTQSSITTELCILLR